MFMHGSVNGLFTFIAVVVDFMQSAYSATENNGFVQIELVSSNPSSSDITIEVLNAEASATGEYLNFYTILRISNF